MNSKERILSAMKCEKPDRVPVSPWGLGNLDPDGACAQKIINETDILVSAGISDGNIFLGKAAETTVRKEDNKTITTLKTPEGELTQVRKSTEETAAVVKHFCDNRSDIEKILSIPFEPLVPDLDYYFREKEKIGDEGLVLANYVNPVCFPATILSPEKFCLLWVDDRDLMKKLVKTASERLNQFTEKACERGVDVFRLVGGEFVTQQLGPVAFDELVKPYDSELVNIIHNYNGLAHYHNHGYVTDFLEDFIELGIDSLDPLEIPPYGDIDLSEAKDILGGEVCIVGPLDDMEVLSKKSEEEILEMGRQCIKDAGPDGYMLGGTSSGTYGEKAASNFISLVKVAESLA